MIKLSSSAASTPFFFSLTPGIVLLCVKSAGWTSFVSIQGEGKKSKLRKSSCVVRVELEGVSNQCSAVQVSTASRGSVAEFNEANGVLFRCAVHEKKT